MNINTVNAISFGKIVRVNTPEHIAENLVRRINAGGRKTLDRDLKKIFNDTKEGEATVHSCGGEIFILSGKEGAKSKKLDENLMDEIDRVHAYYGADDLAVIQSDESTELYAENMAKLIESVADKKTLNVECDKQTGEIKSVNLIA